MLLREWEAVLGNREAAAVSAEVVQARRRSQPGLIGKKVFPMSWGSWRIAPGGERMKSAG